MLNWQNSVSPQAATPAPDCRTQHIDKTPSAEQTVSGCQESYTRLRNTLPQADKAVSPCY